jgi:hypothetical protein
VLGSGGPIGVDLGVAWLCWVLGVGGWFVVLSGCGEESLWCCLELVVNGCCMGHECVVL